VGAYGSLRLRLWLCLWLLARSTLLRCAVAQTTRRTGLSCAAVLLSVLPAAEMAIMMYVQGRADLGMGAALKAIPLALGLAVAAKALVDRQLQTRWVLGVFWVGVCR
jgi:hypothetical protein